MPTYRIGLLKATLLCVNTMMGAALFINPKELTRIAGSFGFLGYAVSALILLPLIFSVAELARLHPVSGGLYVYSKKHIHSAVGFISGWSYFISKSVASGFLVHVFASFFKSTVPFLAHVPTFYLDYIFIISFIALNMLGVRVGGRVQYLCFLLKVVPILFVFICGCLYFTPSNFAVTQSFGFEGFLKIIPISLYAFAGFEIICAVGGFVKNPEVNIRRAILIAFFSITSIYILFSIIIYGIVGKELAMTDTSLLMLGLKSFPQIPVLGNIINGFVFSSIIGSAYSVFTSNCWNFHTLVKNNHLPFSRFLTKVNSVQAPWPSLIVEGSIACFALAISREQIPLQNMSVLALFVSCFLTAITAYRAAIDGSRLYLSKWIPLLAIGSCGYIIYLCLGNIIRFGVSVSFLAIFFVGCILALGKRISLGRLD